MLIVLNTRNAETGHLVDKIFLLQIIIFPTLDFNCSGPGGIDGRDGQTDSCVHCRGRGISGKELLSCTT